MFAKFENDQETSAFSNTEKGVNHANL